jgi:hypothetical protein
VENLFDTGMEDGAVDKEDAVGCFDSSLLGPSNDDELAEMFLNTSQLSDSSTELSPSTLDSSNGIKRPSVVPDLRPSYPSDTQSDSPGDSSHVSSPESGVEHTRNHSIHSNASEVFSPGSMGTERLLPNGWHATDHFSPAARKPYFGQQNASSPLFKNEFVVDPDLEMSNKAMDSAFDFESAASSPSPLKMEAAPKSKTKPGPSQQSFAHRPQARKNSAQVKFAAIRVFVLGDILTWF